MCDFIGGQPECICALSQSGSQCEKGILIVFLRVRVMLFNATFNNISVILCWSVLLVEETEGPGENHRPAASH
jgi:hypothetical protein